MSDAASITHDDLGGHGNADAHVEHPTSTGISNKKLLMWLFLASDCMFFGTLISTHLVYRKVYPYGAITKGIVDVTNTFDIELTSFSTFILLMSSFLMALAVSAMHKGQLKSFRRATIGVMFFGLIFLGCQVYEFTNFFDGRAEYTFSVKTPPTAKFPNGEVISSTYHGSSDVVRAQAHLAVALVEEHPDWLTIPAPKPGEPVEKTEGVAPTVLADKHPSWVVAQFKQTKVERASLSLQNSVFGSTFFMMTGTHGCHVAGGVLWLAALFFYSYSGRMEKNMHGAALDVEVAGLYWHFVDIVWIVIFTAVYLVEYIPGYGPGP